MTRVMDIVDRIRVAMDPRKHPSDLDFSRTLGILSAARDEIERLRAELAAFDGSSTAHRWLIQHCIILPKDGKAIYHCAACDRNWVDDHDEDSIEYTWAPQVGEFWCPGCRAVQDDLCSQVREKDALLSRIREVIHEIDRVSDEIGCPDTLHLLIHKAKAEAIHEVQP